MREAQINEDVPWSSFIRHALGKYQELLHRNRYLDYSMLLTEAVRCLESDYDSQRKNLKSRTLIGC